MTYNEFRQADKSLTREAYTALRHSVNETRTKFVKSVDTCLETVQGYAKLTKAQQDVIRGLAFCMAEAHLGDEYVINHYELTHNRDIHSEWSQKYYQMRKEGLYLAIASSSTLRALEKKGFIDFVKDAGRGIDTVRVLFTVDFTNLYRI